LLQCVARWRAVDPINAAVREQDQQLAAQDLEIWIGAEPTYTRRDSVEPPWTAAAEGGDKEPRARALLNALASELGRETSVARWIGRHFPGEPEPRFCYALVWSRDGEAPPSVGELEEACEPPKLDPRLSVLTVTPDPGVVEVNTAPSASLAEFLAQVRAIERAAHAAGLSPMRFRWNGDVADSGGGGQITLGGPSAEDSPFFRHPQLLPSLVRYFNHHPSLSYAFAMECVGASSQAPRADEGTRERFDELGVALARFAYEEAPSTPDEIGGAFAGLLVDASGNWHRAEINIEKLWNDGHSRGKLGVVEFRALGMQPTPERTVAIASLLRAIAARLAMKPFEEPLLDWGRELHDRFALPWFIARDLEFVLADLAEHGFALPTALRELLACDPEPIAQLSLAGAKLSVRRAREFWPLVGDVASQELSTSRLVDPSTERLEVRVEGEGVQVLVDGWTLPLVRVAAGASVASIRRRVFVPLPGLHQGLPPHDPIELLFRGGGEAISLRLHAWRSDGEAYEVLPADAREAEERRRERVHLTPSTLETPAREVPPWARTGYGIDLRRLPVTKTREP
jgi:uncharacterized protein (DUF2126 family)